MQNYLFVFDAVRFKLCSLISPKESRKQPAYIRLIEFPSKAFELISYFDIFNNINVTSKLYGDCNIFCIPTIIYSLTNRNKQFNFNKFVTSIDIDAFLVNTWS